MYYDLRKQTRLLLFVSANSSKHHVSDITDAYRDKQQRESIRRWARSSTLRGGHCEESFKKLPLPGSDWRQKVCRGMLWEGERVPLMISKDGPLMVLVTMDAHLTLIVLAQINYIRKSTEVLH